MQGAHLWCVDVVWWENTPNDPGERDVVGSTRYLVHAGGVTPLGADALEAVLARALPLPTATLAHLPSLYTLLGRGSVIATRDELESVAPPSADPVRETGPGGAYNWSFADASVRDVWHPPELRGDAFSLFANGERVWRVVIDLVTGRVSHEDLVEVCAPSIRSRDAPPVRRSH